MTSFFIDIRKISYANTQAESQQIAAAESAGFGVLVIADKSLRLGDDAGLTVAK